MYRVFIVPYFFCLLFKQIFSKSPEIYYWGSDSWALGSVANRHLQTYMYIVSLKIISNINKPLIALEIAGTVRLALLTTQFSSETLIGMLCTCLMLEHGEKLKPSRQAVIHLACPTCSRARKSGYNYFMILSRLMSSKRNVVPGPVFHELSHKEVIKITTSFQTRHKYAIPDLLVFQGAINPPPLRTLKHTCIFIRLVCSKFQIVNIWH